MRVKKVFTKNLITILILVCLIVSLCSCRTRLISGGNANISQSIDSSFSGDKSVDGSSSGDNGNGESGTKGDSGGIAGVFESYTTLLSEGSGSLYPCQMPTVYIESETDYLTYNKKSVEHTVLLAAGGLNVAEERADTLLNINDEVIVSYNPEFIIKIVESSVLGGNVVSLNAVKDIEAKLKKRVGMNLACVRNGNVMFVSRELFLDNSSKLYLELMIAKTLYPELYLSFDETRAREDLSLSVGEYVYNLTK